MAKTYSFDYVSIPGKYKNSRAESKAVGAAFANYVYEVLFQYALPITNSLGKGPHICNSLGKDERERYFFQYVRGRNFEYIYISFTKDNKLIVYFGHDSLIPENSNDEIIADIRAKAIEKGLISEDAEANVLQEQGCYIATAVYGSYDCPEVWTLRRFRDFFLAKRWYGRIFIKLYYVVSPILVKWFSKTVWFKIFWQNTLNKMIDNLQKRGYVDSPYRDQEWK